MLIDHLKLLRSAQKELEKETTRTQEADIGIHNGTNDDELPSVSEEEDIEAVLCSCLSEAANLGYYFDYTTAPLAIGIHKLYSTTPSSDEEEGIVADVSSCQRTVPVVYNIIFTSLMC